MLVNRTVEERLAGARNPELRTNSAVLASQLSHLTEWYGFPPRNSGKITAAIQSRIQSAVSTKAEPEEATQAMVADMEALLSARSQ